MLVNTLGWAWLAGGLFSVLLWLLGRMGAATPVGAKYAHAFSLPWSRLIPMMGMDQNSAAAVMLVGVLINAALLFRVAAIFRA